MPLTTTSKNNQPLYNNDPATSAIQPICPRSGYYKEKNHGCF